MWELDEIMNARIRAVFILLAVVVVGIAVWFFCSDVLLGGKIRNVVLISIDTCRADYLSCYGYPRRITPNIDAVAKESILFENVVVPVPLTLPSHSSMLTGTIPPYHGIHDNLDYQLDQSNITLAEILKDNGFVTGAIISCFVLDSQFGLDQGFDTYNDQFEEEHYAGNISERIGGEASRFALEWLEEHKNERFFFFLHYYDPHSDYVPPEPFASEFWDNPYAGEIAYTDYCISRVIKKLKDLGLYDSTLLIITGDHGEMLGEHGESEHGFFIYESAIKVPLIFKLPGRHKSKRIKEMVGLIDIVPTVYSLLGIEPPGEVQGVDLSACFGRKKLANRQRHIYCESLYPTKYNANSLLGVVTERWKYIQTTRPELYDIAEDRQESNNLVAKEPQRARILQDRLKQILEEQVCKRGSESKLELDEEGKRRLESLGYVAGSSVSEDFSFDQTKEDPKDLIDFHNANGRIALLIFRKKYAEAKELCEEMLIQRPEFFGGHINMAQIAMKQDDFARAIPHLYNALKLKPDRYEVHNNLGTTFAELGKFEEAVKCFEEALRLGPGKPMVLSNLGFALLKQGKLDEAIENCTKALEIDPQLAEAHYNLGVSLAQQGKLIEAVKHYEKSLQFKPDQFCVHNDLANTLFKQEKFDEAITNWAESLHLNPDQAEVHNNIGLALGRRGNLDEAIKHYNESIRLEPNQSNVYRNLGSILAQQKRIEEATTNYRKSLDLDPNQPEVLNALAAVLICLEKLDEALEIYTKSSKLKPRQPVVHKLMADILFKQVRLEDAIGHYTEALQLEPNMPLVHNSLAELYFQQEKIEPAFSHWAEALKLKPDWPDVLNNMAWCRAAYEAESFHEPDEAVQLAQKACELTGHKEVGLLDTLSVAYAAAGKFDEAVETAEKAIELALSSGQNELAEEIQKHLQLYKAGEPYRKLP